MKTPSATPLRYHRSPLTSAPASARTVSFPVIPLVPGGDTGVTLCHNLRPTPAGNLEGVGRPAAMPAGAMPECRFVPGSVFSHPDGSVSVLLAREASLFVTDGDTVVSLGDLPSAPLTAVATPEGLTVMTAAGPVDFQYSGGEWKRRPDVSALPPLMFERIDGTLFTTSTPAFRSDNSYSASSTRPEGTDATRLGKMAEEAYLRIAGQALSGRQFIQPVMARYRLIGTDGGILFTSAPVLISPAAGLQLTEFNLPMTGSGLNEFGPCEVSATGFSLALRPTRPPGKEWAELVRSIEILISPQLHPLSPGEACTGRVIRSAGGTPLIRILLPGVSDRRRPGEQGGTAADRIGALLSRDTVSFKAVASAGPLSDPATRVEVCPGDPAMTSATDEIKALRRIMDSRVPEPDVCARALYHLSPPHTFAAASSSRNGNSLLWGDITALPFRGYPLGAFATAAGLLTGGATPTAVKVEMADGSSVVSEGVMHSLRPSALSPLLVYPSGEARSITLITPQSTLTFPLTPAPGGKWSYYLDPGLVPIPLTAGSEGGFAVPAASPAPKRWPGLVALASAAAPHAVTDVAFPDTGTVTAITPVRASGSQLDMSRCKYHIFGPGGVARISCSPTAIKSTGTLTSEGITSPHAVALTPHGAVAMAGRKPVLISGNRVKLLREGITGDMAGWNATTGEVWIFTSGHPDATVIDMESGACYTRSLERTTSLIATPAGLWLTNASGLLLDCSSEADSNTVAVHKVRIRVSYEPGSTLTLKAGPLGEMVNATLSLHADNGLPDIADKTPLLGIRLEGHRSHQYVTSFRAIHTHYLTLVTEILTSQPSKLTLQ